MTHPVSRTGEKLAEFGPLMDKRQLAAAVRTLYAVCQTVSCSALSEGEREEASRMLAQSIQTLNADADVQKAFPFPLAYKPGREKELIPILGALLAKLKALPHLDAGKIAC
ncbi:MAG: hypothetical protein HQK81_07955 [Desulfovibrionaceae bacterium]|nr:hypothetical protein [Desulfovibrionaceae bacterium]MBF0513984.1 hypothetical protein [Desulfovibrionaceae bacterium]